MIFFHPAVCPLDITKCPEALKCFNFLGKRAENFKNGASRFLSGGSLKDFNGFFEQEDGLKGCVKGAGQWFKKKSQGCDVDKDGNFKEFTKCIIPMFKGLALDNLSSPSLYVSVGASAIVGVVGGGTTFDVNFGLDGSIIFTYTKCNTLATPSIGGGVDLSVGIFGSKNDIKGKSFVLAVGAGIPGTKIASAGGEMVYSTDGSRVIAMGANFCAFFLRFLRFFTISSIHSLLLLAVGASLDLSPVAASCSSCDTKYLGCATTLEQMGLGYLMWWYY